jgi:hypothetical protein
MEEPRRNIVQLGCVLLLFWPLLGLLIYGLFSGWSFLLLGLVLVAIAGLLFWVIEPAWH